MITFTLIWIASRIAKKNNFSDEETILGPFVANWNKPL